MTYKVQINDEVRNATPEEAAAIQASHDQAAQQAADHAAKIAAHDSAVAKLKALGLNDLEIAALIGA